MSAMLSKRPDDPNVRAVNGTLLLMKKDAAGARREYEAALQRQPAQIDALAGMAAIEGAAGQVDRSHDRVKAQLDKQPRNTNLMLLLARIELAQKNPDSAERRLRSIIEMEPSNMRAYDLLGRLYIDQRKLAEARHEFQVIADKQPKAVGANTIVGMLYHTDKQTAEAEKAYKRALDADPSAPVAANNLAYIYAERGENLDEALALAKAAALRLPEEPQVMDTIGWIYYKKQIASLAIPQFQQCVDKDPKNAVYQFHLGLAHAQAGDTAKARAALEQALKLSPTFAGADEARRTLASLKG
jgi:tetratricopeptide (TPR) repeat protein